MNNLTKNVALGFMALFAIALLGKCFGSEQANPADAEPQAIIIQPSDLDAVRLLPKKQRTQYIKPSNFNNQPLATPTPTPASASASASASAPARPIPATFSNDLRIVVVRQGDTLGAIAKRELGDSKRYKDIMRWNNIKDERAITIGMQLQIKLATVPQPVPALDNLSDISSDRTYTVKSGDVLGLISQQFYGTSKKVKLILEANGLSDANSIRVGQKLIIPAN